MKNKSSIGVEISPLAKSVIESLVGKSVEARPSKNGMTLAVERNPEAKEAEEKPTLVKSILNVLNGPKDSIERLAFEADPTITNQYQSLYKAKLKLIPDHILKRIAIQDDLTASIVQARSNQMANFGRPREDRFSMGYVIEPNSGVLDDLSEEAKKEVQNRIDVAIKKFATCGDTKGWSDNEKCSFAQWLSMSTRNAVVVGRLATEVIWVQGVDGKRRFHSFRPIDAGTIYRAAPQKQAAEQVRRQARFLLEQVKNKKLQPEKFEADEYAWVQVLEGRPVQAFTAEECLVHNFYPVPDVELDGYPVTPLDTVIAAVTTHVNITTHNKLYFQSGRAARGMLVIKSDDVDPAVVQTVRQQFNAAINSVNNAWRMPVFGVGAEDDIVFSPIDQGQRDMEFQYLADMNARTILSAFQMSPEELPGWSHLSRGTNNQALSESNNEYRLEAHRDLGIRPLIKQFEDFLNACLFPLIDYKLSQIATIRLVGLDSETAEKESVRIQQDAPVHMTYNEILDKVEKESIDRAMGGDFPLNPTFQAILDKYFTVGQVLEYFMGVKDASKDPSLAYVRDQFWMQWQQMQMQQQQMAMQQQQQAAQGGQPPQDGGQGGPPDSGGGQPQQGDGSQQADGQQQAQGEDNDLTRSLDQAIGLLSKSEAQLPPSRRRLLAQHRKTVENFMKGFEEDLREASKEILDIAEKHSPKE